MSYVFESNKEILNKVQKELNEWYKEHKDTTGKIPSYELVREKFNELIGLTQLIDPLYEEWQEES